jgi:serine/threonine protein phosphatase PrpC
VTSIPTEAETDNDNVVYSLLSSDNIYFDLIDTAHEVQLRKLDTESTEFAADSRQKIVEEIIPIPMAEVRKKTGLDPLVLHDEEADFLVSTMQCIHLMSGAEITTASYVGKDRENNEDGVVIIPDSNQVLVIDAMGGYGNGVTARKEFVEAALKYPGDIEACVKHTQKKYDDIGLEQGGVCIIDTMIEFIDRSYRINLSQAGDVHAILYDDKGELKHESVDEAIGHQVINAVIGAEATSVQRQNGWENFGRLTHATLRAKSGWRLLVYSDGIANHLNANAISDMVTNRTSKQSLAAISKAIDSAMHVDGSYKDNASIAIIDF